MELDFRKQKILKAVVENYVALGEPVSSKFLQNDIDLNVSSATIRNELMYLVENGYLEQPHTSAGRIPTQKGYRYYINNVMKNDSLDYSTKERIESTISQNANSPETILKSCASVLADVSNMVAIVTTPSSENARVHKIRFVATSRYTAMTVFITSNGIVKSKIFRSQLVITPELLALFDRGINKKLSGMLLKEINIPILNEVASSLGEVAMFVPDVLLSVYLCAREALKSSATIYGQTNLLFLDGYDLFSARNVLRFLSDTDEISDFLNNTQGTKIYLGNESGRELLSDSSLISTRYKILGENAGAIALLGPVRTNYKKLVSEVEYASVCVSDLITQLLDLQRR